MSEWLQARGETVRALRPEERAQCPICKMWYTDEKFHMAMHKRRSEMDIDMFKLIDVEFDEINDDDEYAYVLKVGDKKHRVAKTLCGVDMDDMTVTMPEWAAVLCHIV